MSTATNDGVPCGGCQQMHIVGDDGEDLGNAAGTCTRWQPSPSPLVETLWDGADDMVVNELRDRAASIQSESEGIEHAAIRSQMRALAVSYSKAAEFLAIGAEVDALRETLDYALATVQRVQREAVAGQRRDEDRIATLREECGDWMNRAMGLAIETDTLRGRVATLTAQVETAERDAEAVRFIRDEMATPGMRVSVAFSGAGDVSLWWWLNDSPEDRCLAEVDAAATLADAVEQARQQVREDEDAARHPSTEEADRAR